MVEEDTILSYIINRRAFYQSFTHFRLVPKGDFHLWGSLVILSQGAAAFYFIHLSERQVKKSQCPPL
ncbi:C2H2 finger domain transcription factor sebA [Fusarium oxysporum f. sp. albedinis]|nr:C2H2 finger domain transcription factor sebA [Fusarium oxysporum f. sp. albedinis]